MVEGLKGVDLQSRTPGVLSAAGINAITRAAPGGRSLFQLTAYSPS